MHLNEQAECLSQELINSFYGTTHFRQLLRLIKLTMINGYWSDIADL